MSRTSCTGRFSTAPQRNTAFSPWLLRAVARPWPSGRGRRTSGRPPVVASRSLAGSLFAVWLPRTKCRASSGREFSNCSLTTRSAVSVTSSQCGGASPARLLFDRECSLGSNQSPPPNNEEAWSLRQLPCTRTCGSSSSSSVDVAS